MLVIIDCGENIRLRHLFGRKINKPFLKFLKLVADLFYLVHMRMLHEKKILMLIIALCFIGLRSNGQVNQEDKIKGVWLTEKKDGKVEIFQTGRTWSGKLIWGNTVLDENGKPRHDVFNPDPKLRARLIQGLVIITGLEYEYGKWQGGKIYDSTTGKTYSIIVTVNGNNLELRGYIGIPLLGKTTVWTRIN
jgi:uncharacterized protein (DUF2147 family)